MELTDNLNIKQFKRLITPAQIKEDIPVTDESAELVSCSRNAIQDILVNKLNRRIVIVGPCSLHDTDATLEYAAKLKNLQDKVKDNVLIVMRAYCEKPRTVLGWKGMIYDPCLDNSYNIQAGLQKARGLLLEIVKIGMSIATEFVDPIVPQYIADLVSWVAIGARTTESQIHRQMASGLSMPIGFKNSTEGNLKTAVDAIKAASSSHCFMGIDRDGKLIVAETSGNKYCHLVLRGGFTGPNYESEHVAFAKVLLEKTGINTGIIIDCSHANSNKDFKQQRAVFMNVAEQIRQGNNFISGLMVESFLSEGKQSFSEPKNLKYGVSLTDSCIGWEETEELICYLAGI